MIIRFLAATIASVRSALARSSAGARHAGGAIVAGVMLIALPGAGLAHQRLLRSAPSDGARLTAPPAGLRLVFAEAVRLEAFLLGVTGPDGGNVPLGALHHPADSAAIVIGTFPPLSPGRYAMRWKAVGSDGHPTEGTVRFEILPSSADSIVADTLRARTDTARPDSSMGLPTRQPTNINSPLPIFVRWFTFAALASLIGAFFFDGTMQSAARSGANESLVTQIRRVLRVAAVVAAVGVAIAAGARLAVEVSLLRAWVGAGAVLPFLTPGWRAGVAAQVAGAMMACITVLRGRDAPRWMLGVALGLASLGPALAGHAASASTTVLAVGLDLVHIIGAGAWLGGLAYLSLLAIPSAMAQPPEVRDVSLASVLRAFTPVALGGAAALVASGVYAAWIHLGSISALVHADYGRVLLLKLALVSAMAVLGALNWRLFGARTDHTGALSLRRASRLELALGLMILLATAVLVALPTPAPGS